jgi:putative transposase
MKEKDDQDFLSQLPPDFFKQFKTGEDFLGFMDSVFKKGVESMLDAELEAHLGYGKHDKSDNPNSRNGKTQKTIKSAKGTYQIDVPRDRDGSFEPQLVPKRKRMIDQIEDAVISLYANGMTTEDVSRQISELYGVSISNGTVSNITERILIDVKEWQNRALDSVYLILWLDGIVFKVRQDGHIINKCVHIIAGSTRRAKRKYWDCGSVKMKVQHFGQKP